MRKKSSKDFSDQYFKTAILLIELHKIRNGEYPLTLDSLKHIGGWDMIALQSIEYEKIDDGYRLDITRGIMGSPVIIQYPLSFWNGLGIRESNLLE